MFRGYLFVHVPIDRIAAIVARCRNLPGVKRLVQAAGGSSEELSLAAIRPSDIAAMRAEERSFQRKLAALRKHRRPYDGPLKAGDTVELTDGPFTGFKASIDEIEDADRFKVLVEMLGRRLRSMCRRPDCWGFRAWSSDAHHLQGRRALATCRCRKVSYSCGRGR